MTGPSTGPKSGPIVKIAVALPFLSFGTQSAIQPLPTVTGQLPAMPASKRNTKSNGRLGAKAHPMFQ